MYVCMYISVYKYTYMVGGREVNEAKCKLLMNVDKEYRGYSCTYLATSP